MNKYLPVIGAMPTQPSRQDCFSQAINSILRQVDRLYVFLDQFDQIPEYIAKIPGLHIALLPKDSKLHHASRFLVPKIWGRECIVMCFDDDIIYPSDYVEKMKLKLYQCDGRVILGVHGGYFLPPYTSYIKDRQMFHFSASLEIDTQVNLIGVGTAVWLSSRLEVDLVAWKYPTKNDLSFALTAVQQRIPMVLVARQKNWLTSIKRDVSDSLWNKVKLDDSIDTVLMRELINNL